MKLLIAALTCFAASHLAATELTLMSYNIRLDLASDGPNRWDARKEQLSTRVATLAPTVFGIQEGLAHQVDYLESQLSNYAYAGVGRDDAGSRRGIPPVTGDSEEIAAGLRALAREGIDHVQLVLDPINEASIAELAPVLGYLERA